MDKNSKIKALFFDIDGTLVSFQTHRIPQSTVEALEKAKQNGVYIYISTMFCGKSYCLPVSDSSF